MAASRHTQSKGVIADRLMESTGVPLPVRAIAVAEACTSVAVGAAASYLSQTSTRCTLALLSLL